MKLSVSPALKLALLYVAVATLWIIFSDQFIETIAANKVMLSMMQTWKGLIFVFVTGLLVYFVSRFYFSKQQLLIVKLSNNEKRLALILDKVPCGIQENDNHGKITFSNKSHHAILNYPEPSLVGHHIWDFQVSEAAKLHLQHYFHSLVQDQPEPKPFYTKNYTADGKIVDMQVAWDYMYSQHGQLEGMISVITDITEQQRQQQELYELAYFDSLTKLPNRSRSIELLSEELNIANENNEQVSVMILDLDHFKKINDLMDHVEGDHILNQVAERLKSNTSWSDNLGRLGGDEFIFFHRDKMSGGDLATQIDHLLTVFDKPFFVDQREVRLTASIGISIYPQDASNALTLMRNADMAMFYAKEHGRNSYAFFTTEMNERLARRYVLEEQLQTALIKNELHLLYQPQIDLITGKMIGAEALLRWHNPTLGQVSPIEFIEVAEQSNLIITIGEFVLESALRFLSVIQNDVDSEFTIAINLSPKQFSDINLVNVIRNLMEKYQVNPALVELEITEGVLLSGSSLIEEKLHEINALGVSLSMDDFGTGYSSLSYLRSYPFNVLKIDRAFINDIVTDESDCELINAIVAMSQALGMKVVAEGVELQEQVDFLQRIGCDVGQGFFFSKPITEPELLALLHQQDD